MSEPYSLGEDIKNMFFFYRGHKEKFRIIKQKSQPTPKESGYTLHPNLINYVITKLESQLYSKAVRLSRAAKQNSLSDTQRGTGQNQVPV